MQDQTNLESLADAAATIPNAMYVASKGDATPSHKLDMGDHIVMWPEQKDEPYSDPYYKPQETDADENDEEKSLNLKERITDKWNKAKSSKVFWVLLGCGILVIVSVVIAVVLPSFIQPGSKKAQDALKQDSLFGLKPTNSSAWASTIFYKETTSFLVNTKKSATPWMATFMEEQITTDSYSPSFASSLRGESTEPSTKANDSPGIKPMTTPLSTTDINECIRKPCQRGRCVNKDGGYKCTCSPGWTGQNYINECTRNPCKHGTCVNQDGGYKCTCPPGWTGKNCQLDINECIRKPCQHGSCFNKDGGYKCTCSPGWTGQNCQQDINECIRKPCQHGSCFNKDGGYKCTCSPGWTGQNCQQDIDDCNRNPCKHGRCVNNKGGYKCTCSPGWTGQNCQEDINECTRNPCQHGTCVNQDGGYKCTCPPGWTGQNCRQDINECTRNPCKHGTCVNKDGGYKCTCLPGWTGQNCQQDVDECTDKPCQHGTCVNQDGWYECTCSTGWFGQNCQRGEFAEVLKI
ncbi:PREDICTED: fibropellin-1-like [Branchiostoma belcheri]|uniref:Fibropellin-1-like n=1 Tax=Branchiostoma belcheri TaxID=7741 RepID=A0A6P4ZDV8_BRABE|nr:PREDICTED: fibropellin-1-like [Branchiostoma belcheri]